MSESPLPLAAAGLGDDASPPLAPSLTTAAAIRELEQTTAPGGVFPPVIGRQVDNHLAFVRLGIASSLFAALRFRYAGTASHALRVALNCSSWAEQSGLDIAQRDALEVAALLHDVGVIGVPDQILLKPGPLDSDEIAAFEQSRRMTVEILRNACAEPAVLAIVENVGAWFDGSRNGYALAGNQIPLGARMLAIVEAFDAMTVDQVFRRAIPQERALRELFACAGRQFDPDLVQQFAHLSNDDWSQRRRETARHWLQTLDPESNRSFWAMNGPDLPAARNEPQDLFECRLLDNMHDAVVFIDAALRIVQWNHGAERLTGVIANGICQRAWSPGLLTMQNEKGQWLSDDDCPVRCALRSGTQSLRRLTIAGRGGRPVPVDSHTIPVAGADGAPIGVVLILHDASSEISLEERCQSLHEKATRDPLTQVANRAEFDRVLEMFVNAHRQHQVPCALMICDLDHFKQVNDNYGHQAGDEVIKCLAMLLRNSCRTGDLVARYGGEEFVLLCADCDVVAGARRAEHVRKTLSRIPQADLEGGVVTASFGVTEIQPGDTPETMLRRSDRALLMAKDQGRNRVVQLGVGSEDDRHGGLMSWLRKEEAPPLVVEQLMVTPVPIAVALEKLRGFVADHRAKIVHIDGNHIQFQVEDDQNGVMRRASDRPVTFAMNLELEEERVENTDRYSGPSAAVSRTRIHLTITPLKNRDRRADVAERARELLVSFRSYLIAVQEESDVPEGLLRRASKILTPWLSKRP